MIKWLRRFKRHDDPPQEPSTPVELSSLQKASSILYEARLKCLDEQPAWKFLYDAKEHVDREYEKVFRNIISGR